MKICRLSSSFLIEQHLNSNQYLNSVKEFGEIKISFLNCNMQKLPKYDMYFGKYDFQVNQYCCYGAVVKCLQIPPAVTSCIIRHSYSVDSVDSVDLGCFQEHQHPIFAICPVFRVGHEEEASFLFSLSTVADPIATSNLDQAICHYH